MTDFVYDIKNLNFSFNNKPPFIVNNANLNIRKGRMTAIAGVNGSGKSTFLRLLIRFLIPTNGEIYFMNKRLSQINQKKLSRHISYVGQNPNEDIPLRVSEVINFGNYPYENMLGRSRVYSIDNLTNALEITKTLNLKDKIFTHLSIGEKQKVMIARAICQNTSVILLDEPTSSLDIKNEVEIMKLLRYLVETKNITVILISHNLNLISVYADDIIFLNKGQLLFGEKEDIFTSANLQEVFNTKINHIRIEDKNIFYH